MNYSPLTISDLWRAIKARALTVVFTAVVFVLVAALYAFLTTPVYRSEVLMSVVNSPDDIQSMGSTLGGFGGLASLTGLNLEAGNKKVESLAVLRSRFFTEKFIAERELMPALFSEKWDSARGTWNSEEIENIPTAWQAYKVFDRDVRSVDEDSSTGLVTLTIDWYDRQQAAEWANLFVADLNNHLRKIAILEAQKSINYLNEALEKTSVVELRNVIFQLIEKQVRVITLANVREEYAFRVLDPAVPADPEQYVWPKKSLIIVLGLFLGLLVGIALAILIAFSSPNGPATQTARR